MPTFLQKLIQTILRWLGRKETAVPLTTSSSPATTAAPEAAVAGTASGETTVKLFNKIGFHTGPGGNTTGLGDWMRKLDAAGIPFMIKSVDSYGPVFEASELAKQSGVPHVLVYRVSTVGQGHKYDYDVPPYKDPKYVNDPEGGAELHWRRTLAKLPPEFDKKRTWIEPINEVDKNLCDWLGRFAVHIANLAQKDGYKVSLFAWSSGEPEPEGWEAPGMLAYLRLCAERPEQAAVALHEYSYEVDDIKDMFPYKIGRFQFLFDVCDKHGIARPTVHITEWGWTLNNVPGPQQAIRDMRLIGKLYARYPQITGAAIWYLGPSFGGIANRAQRLIQPVTEFTLKHRFEVTLDKPEPVTPPGTSKPKPPPPPVIGQPPEIPPPHPPGGPVIVEPPPPPPVTPPQPAPQPNAVFVADVTIPDDTHITAGATFEKTWRMRNTGNVIWNDGYRLVHVGGAQLAPLAEQPLPPLMPGKTGDITVTMTAPQTPGMTYSDWRLRDDQGNWFGDLVYTRIIVDPPAITGVSGSRYVADVTIPDDMVIAPGTRFVKTWRVKNSGTRPWNKEFALEFVEGVPMTSVTRHPLPPTPPGATVNVSIELTAPLTQGTYYCDWRMRDDRGFLFGDVLYARIDVPETADPADLPDTPVIDDVAPEDGTVTPLQTGVNINPDAPHSNPLQGHELTGLGWVRFVFKLDARVNEAERGDLDAAFAQYDPLIAALDKQGVKALLVLNQETIWGSAPWENNGDYAAYADALAAVAGRIAARYRRYRDRVAYEIWNEGDLPNNTSSVFVPPKQFAVILRKTADAIRAGSPDAKRIFGGLATGPQPATAYVQAVRDALGGALPVEAIGVHPYGRWGTRAPFDWGQKFGTLGQALAEYRAGFGALPIWITEIGVAADTEIGPDYYDEIGAYMRDLYATTAAHHSAEAPVMIWFAWSDWMRNAGVVDRNGRRKAAVYAAFQDIRRGAL